ncbi:DUF4129 domain-containing transglutaminase family protein [Metabacillus sp. RGM 3146]|uniref:DUF4129 domain-containing transglutaminase family protein n=1 Tax=Metabacillus sp. RGM 3146 TaxID=3401092 RepID=UPI003B99FF6F
MMQKIDRSATSVFYYLFAFMLLSEWLIPLQQITDTGNITIFVSFIALSLLLTFFGVKWYYSILIQGIYIFFILGSLFYEGRSPFDWITEWIQDAINNIGVIQHSSWMDITSPFRTFLFFILLWLLVYLLHYWMVYQKKMTFFFIMTLIYITILDTFTPYEANGAVVRVLVVGFLLLGMLSFERLKSNERVKHRQGTMVKWIAPLAAITAIAAGIGIIAPKAKPQWPDPVPYLTSFAHLDSSIGGGALKKIGYGTNDESLGGPFMKDNTLVFNSFVQRRHYWRVETKDIYTGKGWNISRENQVKELVPMGNVKQTWIGKGVKTEMLNESVSINGSYSFPHLVYPLGLSSIKSNQADQLSIRTANEMIIPVKEGRNTKIRQYDLTYEYPSYNIDKLTKKKTPGDLPDDFMRRYTQLPQSVPKRVKELALKITREQNNEYDKAKAIERYLGSSDYSYNIIEVAVPGPDDDYVDQFLFDSMKGYCDNFSTSMVVLLREAGIPSRWVKGYSEGEYQSTNASGLMQYDVTNNNAHSWVEVYFEGIGWVPFEPTKGFSNPASFTYEPEQSTVTQTQPQKQTPAPIVPKPNKNLDESTSAKTETAHWKGVSFSGWPKYAVIFVLVLSGFSSIYFTRRKWLPYFLILKYKRRNDGEVFFKAYPALLKQLSFYGFRRESNQTLREFAREVDRSFNNQDMIHLTASYERALYRRDDAGNEWRKVVELWENLIKRTSS